MQFDERKFAAAGTTGDEQATGSGSTNVVLQAYRLGYLTVEAYSRLKSRDNRKPKRLAPDPNRRFEFAQPGEQSQYYQILRTAGQLHAQARALDLEPPPLPTEQELKDLLGSENFSESRLELHDRVDDWAQDAEVKLSLENEEAAQAFVFGGSFASTYWHGYKIPVDQTANEYADLLSAYRLRQTVERLEFLREHMPLYFIESVGYSMKRWSIGKKIKSFESFDPENTRLESQMTIWRDMLFGRRPPETFLTIRMRNHIQYRAYLSTTGLVVSGLLVFWLVLWSVPTLVAQFNFTGWLVEVFSPATSYIQAELPIQVDSKLEGIIKAGSALIATISAVTVFIAGVVARVSGWILRLHARVDFWFRSRAIQKRTLREPNLSKLKTSTESAVKKKE